MKRVNKVFPLTDRWSHVHPNLRGVTRLRWALTPSKVLSAEPYLRTICRVNARKIISLAGLMPTNANDVSTDVLRSSLNAIRVVVASTESSSPSRVLEHKTPAQHGAP